MLHFNSAPVGAPDPFSGHTSIAVLIFTLERKREEAQARLHAAAKQANDAEARTAGRAEYAAAYAAQPDVSPMIVDSWADERKVRAEAYAARRHVEPAIAVLLPEESEEDHQAHLEYVAAHARARAAALPFAGAAAEAYGARNFDRPWSEYRAAAMEASAPVALEMGLEAAALSDPEAARPYVPDELQGSLRMDVYCGAVAGAARAFWDEFLAAFSCSDWDDEEDDEQVDAFRLPLEQIDNLLQRRREVVAAERLVDACAEELARWHLAEAGEKAEALRYAAPGVELASALEEFKEARDRVVTQKDRLQVDAAAHAALINRRFDKRSVEQLLRGVDRCGDRRPFTDVGGKLLLEQAEPTDDIDRESNPLVEGLIPSGSVGAVVGDYSVGKTWLLIDLGLSIAFGEPWLGRTTRPRPVIFIAAEGQRAMWNRIAAWLVQHGKLPREFSTAQLKNVLDGRFLLAAYPPKLDDPDLEPGLVDTVRELGVGLVIFDTMGKSLGADQLEDSNDVANQVTGLLSRVTADTGCTVFFSHHSGHGDKTRARGASAWTQGVDFAYLIRGTAADFAAGQPVTLVPSKMRDEELPKPRGFKLAPVSLEIDGRLVASAVVVPAEVGPRLSLKARLFAYIEQNPGCGKGAVRGGVQGDNNSIDAALRDLLKGAVENRAKGVRHEYHAVPGWRATPDGQGVEHTGADFLSDLALPHSVNEDEVENSR
jgi:hypothetical protein